MGLVLNHSQTNPDARIQELSHRASHYHQLFETPSPGLMIEKFCLSMYYIRLFFEIIAIIAINIFHKISCMSGGNILKI